MRLIFLFLFLYQTASAQLGLGLGSEGIVLKPFNKKKNSWAFRLNPSWYFGDLEIQPNIYWLRTKYTENRNSYYWGIGAGTTIEPTSAVWVFDRGYYLRLPIGFEYFPFSSKNISVTCEGKLNISEGRVEDRVFFSGLLEVSYYFKKK